MVLFVHDFCVVVFYVFKMGEVGNIFEGKLALKYDLKAFLFGSGFGISHG